MLINSFKFRVERLENDMLVPFRSYVFQTLLHRSEEHSSHYMNITTTATIQESGLLYALSK
jgi:hypothetical protein